MDIWRTRRISRRRNFFINGKEKSININDYKNAEEIINNLSNNSMEKKEFYSFITFLNNKNFMDNRQISLFNCFMFHCSNIYSFSFFWVHDIPLYFVHCKLQNEQINFSYDIGLTFPKDNNKYYYIDIKSGQYLDKSQYDKKFRDYGVFIGLYYVIDD